MDCFTDRERKYYGIYRMKRPNDPEPNILTTTIYI